MQSKELKALGTGSQSEPFGQQVGKSVISQGKTAKTEHLSKIKSAGKTCGFFFVSAVFCRLTRSAPPQNNCQFLNLPTDR